MFEGVRVLEVSSWVMAPSASVMLADLGADVIKVEHPRVGDPIRGLVVGGVVPFDGQVSPMLEQTNRGKRSIGLDFGTPEGAEVLARLIDSADVFLTNFLPPVRQKFGIEADDVRTRNPRIVYARVDALGPRGADAGKPGYDSAVFFGRSGIIDAFSPPETLSKPRPGFGDRVASMAVAFGIASALFQRERTGIGSLVDTSLLGAAMWSASTDIAYSGALGGDLNRVETRSVNPVGIHYQTADGRWIMFAMFESQRWWPEFCRHIGRDDLIADPRSCDTASRARYAVELVAELRAWFATEPLAVWRERLATLHAPWEVVQTSTEVYDDPQALANGYLTEIADHPSGIPYKVVRTPVQFDGDLPELGHAPEAGQHTEEVLLELGYTWDDIGRLQGVGAIP
jgi:crotonobetainyl-CoA:carnitine CoA-transferase CaiB-like acyl-CoA transferase